ncbi:hypothetical protein Tco_0172554 [Tanacetum coccineum]
MVVVRRVRESGSGDRIDRVVGSLFGLAGKIPPEKFSGGGEWWPAVGRPAGEEGGERDVYLQLYYHYIPFQGKKSSSRPSIDILKISRIQCRESLPYFSLSSSELTISASTHLRNLYISKKISSRCQNQVYTLDSSNLSLLASTPTILGLDA